MTVLPVSISQNYSALPDKRGTARHQVDLAFHRTLDAP